MAIRQYVIQTSTWPSAGSLHKPAYGLVGLFKMFKALKIAVFILEIHRLQMGLRLQSILYLRFQVCKDGTL
jgi:hypothetical protein